MDVAGGVDEGQRERWTERRRIDLIYEFDVTFGTDLHRRQMAFDFSNSGKLFLDLPPHRACLPLSRQCARFQLLLAFQ